MAILYKYSTPTVMEAAFRNDEPPCPDDHERERFHFYLAPPPEDFLVEDLGREIKKIAILADGNNRAGGDYSKGGKNIVELAEKLLLEEGIDLVLALILSPENIAKRGPAFFKKIRDAFLVLGNSMIIRETLGSLGIKLDYAGNVAELEEDDKTAALSETTKAVKGINEINLAAFFDQEPPDNIKTLLLGINYLPKVLEELDIDLILRPGMEEENVVRVGSTQPTRKTILAADTVLSPNMTIGHLLEKRKAAQKIIGRILKKGHSPAETIGIVNRAATHISVDRKLTLTIPYTGTPTDAEKSINSICISGTFQTIPFQFDLVDKTGTRTFHTAANKDDIIFRIVMDGVKTESIDAMILPGQTGQACKVVGPDEATLGYANAFPCEGNPPSIIETIHRAVTFTCKYKGLQGAERAIAEAAPILAGPIEPAKNPEFQRYFELKEMLETSVGKSLEEVADTALEGDDDVMKKYNLLADLFVARMLQWVDTLGITWNRDVEFRALTNYIFSSFFLACYPTGKDSKEFIRNWEIVAYFIAFYMCPVYLMDDRAFDATRPDPGEKQKIMDTGAENFIQAIKLANPAELPNDFPERKLLEILAREFKRLSTELHEQSSPRNFDSWQKNMVNLFECHHGEWNSQILDNELVRGLGENYEAHIDQFRERYAKANCSPVFQARIDDALRRLQSTDETEKHEAMSDLRLYAYLCDVENSIGVGLIYRTIACIDSKNTPPNENIERVHDEICLLSNLYFRLANDLAEIYRAADDREKDKIDSCHFMYEKYAKSKNPAEALIYAGSDIYKLIAELEDQLNKKKLEFQELCKDDPVWNRVSMAVMRSDIGKMFYKGTHYREATRDMVASFFKVLYHFGLA